MARTPKLGLLCGLQRCSADWWLDLANRCRLLRWTSGDGRCRRDGPEDINTRLDGEMVLDVRGSVLQRWILVRTQGQRQPRGRKRPVDGPTRMKAETRRL